MKKIYFVLFAILCTIIFACTDNLTSTELDSNQNSSTGELKVFVKQSRLYSPVISEISWTVNLVDEENNTYSSKETEDYFLFSNLKLGTYTVNASGKDSLGVERFWGSITINFDSTKPCEVFIPVSASKNPNSDTTSTGFVTITMDMSEELISKIGSKVFFQAELIGADEKIYIASFVDEENLILFDNQQITFAYTDYTQSSQIQTTDIPAGYYNLSFGGLKEFGYSIKLKDTLVEVGAGLTTNIVLTQNDYHLVKNYETYLFVDNSENANDENSDEMIFGKTLSNPIGFSKLTVEDFIDNELIYLLSDVDFVYDTETKNLYPDLGRFSATISSFGSTVRTISANISDYGSITLGDGTTLKNIKLSGTNGFYFTNLNLEETVIFDCEMGADSPCVQLSKTSNLQIGENFSGNLYLSLSQENWKVGDTVINLENGKPENSNFYIDSECENSSGQKYSSMFYIDDSGKLAKCTDDFTAFAWTGEISYLVTKTQIKNNTYTSIYTDYVSDDTFLYGYTGVSTYDGDKTWYFITTERVNDIDEYSLYSVVYSDVYTNTVIASKLITTLLGDNFSLGQVRGMSYDDGKLYFGIYNNGTIDVYYIDINSTIVDYLSSFTPSMKNANISDLSALLVKENDFYFATDFIDYYQPDNSITHSAIWKYELTMEETDNGTFYNLIPVQTYQGDDGAVYHVPYYLTQNDNSLTIDNSFPEDSTFRITDLYSDGTSVYGLLANYVETNERTANRNVYMRGSVFKLEENTNRVAETYEPIMNAIQYSLRETFPLSSTDLPLAKQYFILPRKIVGIINKKLIIADDGVIPDEDDCNLDRFILFDLDGTISEKIDVNFVFTTNVHASDYNYDGSKDFATGSLF